MSPLTPTPAQVQPEAERILVKNFKTPILVAVMAVIALVFALTGTSAESAFDLSQSSDRIQLAPLTFQSMPVLWTVGVLLVLLAAYAFVLVNKSGRVPGWVLAVGATLLLVSFLVWLVAGSGSKHLSLAGLFITAMPIIVPIAFGALSGVLGERAGVVNIAIEGQLLAGAFSAALVASLTQNAYAGVLAAAVSGGVVAALLALFAIRYQVNQIIVGVVLNVLVSGLTGFFFDALMREDGTETFNTPKGLDAVPIPGLSDIPIIGPAMFNQSLLGYALLAAVAVTWFALFKTRWGLRVRAVGEHPKAADTLGVNVNRTRWNNVLLGGLVAGLGGSYFTLVATSAFSKEMTGGLGFIALAAMIFGRYNPIGAFFAAVLFGVAGNLASIVSIAKSPVDSSYLAMLPYALTILAVSGLVGRTRPPAAGGIPYTKG
jgi:simple sugar transport system permease protein